MKYLKRKKTKNKRMNKRYAVLFNGITNMTKILAKTLKQMMILYKYGEELCISEPSEPITIDTE